MPIQHPSSIDIDDDIDEYDYDKAQNKLEEAIELVPDHVLNCLVSWLSKQQLIQFVGDELVDDWDDLRPDGWDDEDEEDEDEDEDVEDDDSGEDEE